MAELQRIASHLLAIGTFGLDVGRLHRFCGVSRPRKNSLLRGEWARLLYNYLWVGGVMQDLPDGFVRQASEFLDYFEPQVHDLNKLLSYNKFLSSARVTSAS